MSLYHVGDRVVVRSDLECGERDHRKLYYNRNGNIADVAVKEMVKCAGKTVTILSITDNGKYRIEELGYYWTDDMFDGLEGDLEAAQPPESVPNIRALYAFM